MHKKIESELVSLAHSILQMKNSDDILKLKEKAYIHIATDWEDYADWILDESRQCKNLSLKGNKFHNKPDYRPYTKYEKRGVNLGHKVWDIIFLKC